MAFEITKPAQAVEGIDAILYGDPKTGKTSTLDDPKLKVLLIDLEGGSAVLSEAQNVDRIAVTDYETLIEIGKAIESGKLSGYDMYAVDSLTQFEALVKEYVATKYAPNRRREIQSKFGAMADWGDLRDLVTRTVKWFHGLTKCGDKSIHLVWIAHVADKKEPIPGTDQERVVGKKIALQGGNTAEIVMSIVDAVFYMYNTPALDKDKKPTGEVERGFLTRDMGMFVANARQSKKREPLPARIANPSWSDILDRLGYTKKNVVSAQVKSTK